MSTNKENLITVSPTRLFLRTSIQLLQACRGLAEQLVIYGATFKLSNQDEANLLCFEKLIQTNYSESDWQYLRVASGVSIGGVAALKRSLSRYRSQILPEINSSNL